MAAFNDAITKSSVSQKHGDQNLIFLHLPKTGGITLSHILWRQYRSAEIYPFIRQEKYPAVLALPQSERDKYRLFQGHIPYGLHEYLSRPSVYMTQLREPIQTALSSYFYFELGYRQDILKEKIEWTQPTLDQLRYGTMRLSFNNMQTRYVAGALATNLGEMTREMLALAKARLITFAVVGLMEQFDASVVLMAKALQWNAPYYVASNVRRQRPRTMDLAPDVREWLTEQNQLDTELYEHAKQLFARQVAAQGENFPQAVAEYRRMNARYGPVYDRLSRAKLWARRIPLVGAFV